MVERIKADLITEFDGICRKVEIVPDQMNAGQEQYHLEVEPDDKEILKDSKTGCFHVWLRITKKSTTEGVAEGSNLDMYLREVEVAVPVAKKVKTVLDALKTIEGKHIHYVSKIIGRSYGGFDARPVFIPQREIK